MTAKIHSLTPRIMVNQFRAALVAEADAGRGIGAWLPTDYIAELRAKIKKPKPRPRPPKY